MRRALIVALVLGSGCVMSRGSEVQDPTPAEQAVRVLEGGTESTRQLLDEGCRRLRMRTGINSERAARWEAVRMHANAVQRVRASRSTHSSGYSEYGSETWLTQFWRCP